MLPHPNKDRKGLPWWVDRRGGGVRPRQSPKGGKGCQGSQPHQSPIPRGSRVSRKAKAERPQGPGAPEVPTWSYV